jgi:hypothetical protein
MLKIRSEQMAVFQPVADAGFVARVADFLREQYGDAEVRLAEGTMTIKEIAPERLRAMVAQGVARGRGYGMKWESSLTTFVTLRFLVAPNFDEHPLIARALGDEQVDAEARVSGLTQTVTEANWQAARQAYDVRAWPALRREG